MVVGCAHWWFAGMGQLIMAAIGGRENEQMPHVIVVPIVININNRK